MMQSLIHELRAIRNALLRVLALFFLLAVVFLVPFRGGSVAQFGIERLRYDVVPEGISLVSLTPLDPFWAQTSVAALLAFFLTVPLLLFEVWRFVAPGLYPVERRALGTFLWVSWFLLLCGGVFAYTLLIPAVFQGLYTFVPPGVEALYTLRGLIGLTGGMIVSTGLLFLLPVGMTLLAWLGLVRPSFWRTYARHAALLALLLSAIITPDGSGISMALLALPICVLYGVGYAGSVALGRKSSASLLAEHN